MQPVELDLAFEVVGGCCDAELAAREVETAGDVGGDLRPRFVRHFGVGGLTQDPGGKRVGPVEGRERPEIDFGAERIVILVGQ